MTLNTDEIHFHKGIINLRKPIGWTSNDVIRSLKNRRRDLKIGHAGTLDPFADGVLLICFGKATKQVPELMELTKTYKAFVECGKETDTLDVTGSITHKSETACPDTEVIKNVLGRFTGVIEQEPPKYSAIRLSGTRAYELARNGANVRLEKRRVKIHSISFLKRYKNGFSLEISCSKGTYVRSLARDIARAAGTIGYLKKLTRTQIGPYTIQDALSIQSACELIRKV